MKSFKEELSSFVGVPVEITSYNKTTRHGKILNIDMETCNLIIKDSDGNVRFLRGSTVKEILLKRKRNV